MNVLEARVVLRDRSLLDVIDLSLRFVMARGRAYARCALVVLPPAYAVTFFLAREAGWGWAWTVALALGPFTCAPFTALASRLLFEDRARVRDVLHASVVAVPRLAVVRFVQALSFGFALVPAFWTTPLCLFTNEVIVLEHAGVGTGLARLQRLLSGQFGDAFLAVLFLSALHIVVTFIGDAVGRSVLEDLLEITPPPSMWSTSGSALGLAAYWLFVPYLATARFLLYINVRTRLEGWDVQTRFAAIVARAEESVA